MAKGLEKQAKEILKQAKERGLESNYFFTTTFERYRVQLRTLKELEAAITDNGPLVTKEYVKDRPLLTANPAISEYNKTATAANSTVSTLISIIKNLSAEDAHGNRLADLVASLNEPDE